MDGKSLLLKTTLKYLTEHRKVSLMPTLSLHCYGLGFMVWKALCMLLVEKDNHQPSYKPCSLQKKLSTGYSGATLAQIL